MQYFYRLADIHVLIDTPFEIKIGQDSKEFLSAGSPEHIDQTIQFYPLPEISYQEQGGHWEILQYHQKNDDEELVYHCLVKQGKSYVCVHWPEDVSKKIVCEYDETLIRELYLSNNICNVISLETLFLRNHGLILHSSFIRWEKQGILFSAPSGTGKSTQASLWETYENAEILNGDRAGIRFVEGRWYAYGLPYAGSSGIYRNEKAPVKAIVVLKQAPENRIRKLSAPEAFGHLYPEFSLHRWDKRFCDNAVNYILELLSTIPVYLLECLPDQGAVRVLKNELFPYDEN